MKYILLLVFLLQGCVKPDQFKVGDCIQMLSSGNEFEEKRLLGYPVKILQVGNEYYKTTVQFPILYPEKKYDTLLKSTAHSTYTLVECTEDLKGK